MTELNVEKSFYVIPIWDYLPYNLRCLIHHNLTGIITGGHHQPIQHTSKSFLHDEQRPTHIQWLFI